MRDPEGSIEMARGQVPGTSPSSSKGTDRGLVIAQGVVKKQLTAMGCGLFDLALRGERGLLDFPGLDLAASLELVPRLIRGNRKGEHVYVRPHGESGLILVDDLTWGGIGRMKESGIQPAVVVKTSEGNFQVWIRLAQEPVPAPIRKAAARMMMRQLGGDPGSADAVHRGRLAGFLNTKPEHADARGRHPWVEISEIGPQSTCATALLENARHAAQEANRPIGSPQSLAFRLTDDVEEALALEIARSENPDLSARDFGAVCRLIKAGFDFEAIETALRKESQRHSNPENYAHRTVLAARQRLNV